MVDVQRTRINVALELISSSIRARNGGRSDSDDVSRTLNALVQGISIQILADPTQWSMRRVRNVLARHVNLLLGAPLDHSSRSNDCNAFR